eukprot:3502778-Prymnesium_polylepis.1
MEKVHCAPARVASASWQLYAAHVRKRAARASLPRGPRAPCVPPRPLKRSSSTSGCGWAAAH